VGNVLALPAVLQARVGGAWVCSCFRNESRHRASDLNREAVAATLAVWPSAPAVASVVGPVGMVSFIDREKVRPVMVRGEPLYGWTWFLAGWEVIGETKSGLLALGMRPERMPEARPPVGYQRTLEVAT
jgi:hypothetical protein